MRNYSNGEASELLATVEKVRREKYPELDADLVHEILMIQHRLLEDRAEASKQTTQALNQWASRSTPGR